MSSESQQHKVLNAWLLELNSHLNLLSFYSSVTKNCACMIMIDLFRALLKSCEHRLQTPVLSGSWISMRKQCNWCLSACGNFPTQSLQKETKSEIALPPGIFLDSIQSNNQSVGSKPIVVGSSCVCQDINSVYAPFILEGLGLFIQCCFSVKLFVWFITFRKDLSFVRYI